MKYHGKVSNMKAFAIYAHIQYENPLFIYIFSWHSIFLNSMSHAIMLISK